MLARVIENWLASATERGGYEVAFCQALFAKGHRIFFRSGHGPFEQGKDIITRDDAGRYHAYQLKTGNLTLPKWHSIKDEVEELVRLPLSHPSIAAGTRFKPHLVTTGLLKDPTRATIQAWANKWRSQVDVIDRDGLLRLFKDTQGDILPTSPVDLERFLRLFLEDKRAPLRKEDFARFLEAVVPLDKPLKASDVPRRFAGTALLASYILDGFKRAENHYALAEGWMQVTAYLVALLERFPSKITACRPSLEICIDAWESAARALVDEALNIPRWIGPGITDYAVRGWRNTVLLGYLCCFALYCKIKGTSLGREGAILKKIQQELRHTFLWGESAGPFYYAILLFLWSQGQEELACQQAGALVKMIVDSGSTRDSFGLPDPYYDAQDLVKPREQLLELFSPQQSFRGRSFLLKVLVEFLARRERKQLLKTLWYDISAVDSVEFALEKTIDLYRWRAGRGSLDTRCWSRPQEWQALLKNAQRPTPTNSLLTKRFLPLLLPFLLTYPHRTTPALARLVEASLP